MSEFFVLLSGTIIIVYFSRQSFRKPWSHGFYRFFAWEIILVMFCLNMIGWFLNASSWHQLASWLLLIFSILPLLSGLHQIRKNGKSEGSFENTTTLVTTGIFRSIRHPLYASLILLTWGIFFKSPSWLDGALALASSLFLHATARADESECIQKFGNAYVIYMRTTKMFFPRIY
jgi:protein-S-isoprenylcysteine O-methyltransferase Ste14